MSIKEDPYTVYKLSNFGDRLSFTEVDLLSPEGRRTSDYLWSIRGLFPMLLVCQEDKFDFVKSWQFGEAYGSSFGFKIAFDARANIITFSWRYKLSPQCYSVNVCPYSIPAILNGHNVKDQKELVRLIRKTNPFAPITKKAW